MVLSGIERVVSRHLLRREGVPATAPLHDAVQTSVSVPGPRAVRVDERAIADLVPTQRSEVGWQRSENDSMRKAMVVSDLRKIGYWVSPLL